MPPSGEFGGHMETTLDGPSVFEGLPRHDLTLLLDRLERRAFAAGATVMAEGDSLGEMYIIETGTAEVFMTDADGGEHLINRVGPGATLGEIALITGQPHSATVRAAVPLEVLVLNEHDFKQAASAFPDLYRNLVAILSRRLVTSNRRSVGRTLGRVTLLVDHGAPAVLGYALACSVAWHARGPTLLLRLDDGAPPPPELAALAEAASAPLLPGTNRARAFVLLASGDGAFAPDMLASTLDHLSGHYHHILLQSPEHLAPWLMARHHIRLLGSTSAPAPGPNATNGFACDVRAWSDRDSVRPDRDGVLHVPALDAGDHEALRRGLLPSTSRAGRAIGWAARDAAGLKVGLALGSGSVRGFAHVGVMRVFDRIGLGVDYIGGTSIGGAIAAMWAKGYAASQIAAELEATASAAFRLTLPTRSLSSSQGLRARIRGMAGDTRIEELKIPLAIIATDIAARQEVVFRRGLLWPAVLASLTIPGVYPAVAMGQYTLVDGGVTNPLPINAVASMGADAVVGVKLGRPPRTAEPIEATEPTGGPPSVLEVIMRSLDIVQSQIPVSSADVPTVIIAPEFESVRGVGLRNFQEGKRFIELGEAAAEASLPRLAATLPWLR